VLCQEELFGELLGGVEADVSNVADVGEDGDMEIDPMLGAHAKTNAGPAVTAWLAKTDAQSAAASFGCEGHDCVYCGHCREECCWIAIPECYNLDCGGLFCPCLLRI
jgi:hypothetical protein